MVVLLHQSTKAPGMPPVETTSETHTTSLGLRWFCVLSGALYCLVLLLDDVSQSIDETRSSLLCSCFLLHSENIY